MTMTDARRDLQILRGRDRILKAVVAGTPVSEILLSIASFAEEVACEARTSILLLENGRLLHGAAPSLSAEYVKLVDGCAIGPGIGSCGEAAYTGQRVIVEDVLAHPNFDGLEDLVRLGGFRASWSEPMIGLQGQILGTFALYYSEPRRPDSFEMEFIQSMARIASLVIEMSRMQESLRESEQRFRQLAENVQEVFWLADWRNGRVLYVNPAYQELWGRSPQELYDDPESWTYSIHPEDRQRIVEDYSRNAPLGRYDVEFRIIDGHGKERWIHDRGFPVLDTNGRVERVCGVSADVTERRKREMESEDANRKALESMTTELLLAEERERHRLAEDLHDGPNQTLTLAQMKLDSLLRGAPQRMRGPLEEIAELVASANRTARSLTFQLSPPLLHDFGLEAAVQWLVEDIQKSFAVKVELREDGSPKLLDERVRILLYRAVRELLINVGKHARATRADVDLQSRDGFLVVRVEDDGTSSDPSPVESCRGLGLRTIRERLTRLGGRMEVRSTPQHGTSVTLYAPLLEDLP
jgi:PAS domain S-box-containing protein